MKRLYFLLLFVGFFVCAQTPADSLLRLLPKANDDIKKVDLYNQIASEYVGADNAKAADYSKRALTLSKQIQYVSGQADAYMSIGNIGIVSGDYPKAVESFSTAVKLYEAEVSQNASEKAKTGLGRATGSLGIVYSEQSNYARALHYDLKAIRIFEKMGDKRRLAKLYNNTGIVYRSLKQDFKALEYFIKAIDLQAKSPDSGVGITMTNVGNIYLAQHNFDKAMEYYGKADALFDSFPDGRGRGELHNNIGLLYFETGKFPLAETEWLTAISTFSSIGDTFGSGDTHAHLGRLYLQQKKYDKALEHASASLESARKLDVAEQIVIAQKLLSEIYLAKNDLANAMKHQLLYASAKDSLESHERIRESVQSEMNFEFEKREAVAKKESEKRHLLQNEESKRQLIVTVFIALLVLLLAGIGFLIYNRRQLKKNLTLEKELAEYEQKALHLQMNPHFVFNCLGSISSFIVQNGTDQAIKYLAKFSKLMRLTLEYSKEQLIPIDREIEGLENYLELEQLRFNNIFSFSISKADGIEDDVALPPLLLQPFVENAIIHGIVPRKQAGLITIKFSIDADFLICVITDNGIGITKSTQMKKGSVPVHKSMALDITRKRLDMIRSVTSRQADVEITQTADDGGEVTGTRVLLRLPLQYSPPTPKGGV